ncbi:hypothetical protein D3C72_761490 [compost metagenome]
MTESHKKSAAISIGREVCDPTELLITARRLMDEGFRERRRRGQREAALCREIITAGTNLEKPAKDRLDAMEWRIARHQNPVARYLTLASLITDLGHQSDEDGIHYAVDCALDILSQAAWPQAQLILDEHGRVVGFEDDVYDGWGLAVAVGEVVLVRGFAERLRAIQALVECGIDDLAYEWGLEVAWFLKKQRHAAERGDA